MIMKNFFIEEDGTTAMEYALIAGTVGTAVAVSAALLGGEINDSFADIVTTFGDPLLIS